MAEVRQAHPRKDGAHHVQGAVREIDDVQQPEDDAQPQRQHRVERAVTSPSSSWDSSADSGIPNSSVIVAQGCDRRRSARCTSASYFLIIEQRDWASD